MSTRKAIFITGGGSGIGRCVAHELASLGATVVISGRTAEKLERVAAEIAEDGAVHVEKHYVGRLQGFHFFPDAQAEGIHGNVTVLRIKHRWGTQLQQTNTAFQRGLNTAQQLRPTEPLGGDQIALG